jgi:hypothetical protein
VTPTLVSANGLLPTDLERDPRPGAAISPYQRGGEGSRTKIFANNPTVRAQHFWRYRAIQKMNGYSTFMASNWVVLPMNIIF